MIYIVTNSYPEDKKMFSSYEFEYVLGKNDNITILSFSKCKKNKDKKNVVQLSILDGVKELIFPKVIKKRKNHFNLIKEIFSTNIIQLLKNIHSYFLALSIIRVKRINSKDLIFSYWFTRSSSIAYYLYKLTGVNYICQGHGSDIYIYPPKNIKSILDNSKAIVTVGEKNRKYISERYNIDINKIHVSRLGVSKDFAEKIKFSEDLRDDKKIRFLTVGRYVNVKGIDLLLEAINKLVLEKKINKKVEFTIVGDGPDYEKYSNFINENGLNEIVDLKGWADREKLIYLLKKANAYILPSRSEGLPVVLTEACAASLPIIATNVGSVTEVAENMVNAIIVKSENIDELSKAILKFINMDKEEINKMSNNSYRIYESKYKLEENLEEKYSYINNIYKYINNIKVE